MDYYGLLFLYYLKGLSGKSVLRLFFNIEAGGTEQLLPENTSTPTTTPILADIQYPDGLRTDQYFTYRETPTTVSNKARIKTIKGNTIVWNQLVQNGNFADTSNWQTEYNATVSVANNVLSITPTEQNGRVAQKFTYTANHKLLIMADVKLSSTSGEISRISLGAYAIDNTAQSSTRNPKQSSDWQKLYVFCYSASTHVNNRFLFTDGRASDWGTTQIRNFMAFDLTSMFGEAKANELFASEQSQVGKGLLEFTSLFPLPYYDYNQGSLLSFNGNGIKTVGKNLFDFSQFANGTITFENGVLTGTAGQFYTAYIDVVNNGIDLKYPKNTQITISFDARTEQNDSSSGGGIYFLTSENGTSVQLATTSNTISAIQHISVTIPSNRHIDKLGWTYGSYPSNIWHITNFQVEFGTTETSYEPYTSSTLSLPISTYFPSGMKSAGNAYDELTPIKASVRIGTDDMGSLDWRVNPNVNGGFNCRVDGMKLGVSGQMSSVICPLYETINTKYYGAMNTMQNMQIAQSNATQGELYLINTSYSDVDTFKQAMSGIPLYFELATPTETPITTEDANEALSLLMGKSVSSNNAKQMIDIITKGE